MKTKAEKLAVMEAWLDGKEIEYHNADTQQEWFSIHRPLWDWDNYDYRIKPQPITKRVPLTMEDIPPMCWLRTETDKSRHYLVTCIDHCWVWLAAPTLEELTYRRLQENNWQYSPDRVNWKPCYKEITE